MLLKTLSVTVTRSFLRFLFASRPFFGRSPRRDVNVPSENITVRRVTVRQTRWVGRGGAGGEEPGVVLFGGVAGGRFSILYMYSHQRCFKAQVDMIHMMI